MKRGVRIALIIGVSLLSVGLIIAWVALATGAHTSIHIKNGEWIVGDFVPDVKNDFLFTTIGTPEKVATGKIKLEPFEALALQTCALDIKVVISDDYGIELNYKCNEKIAYGVQEKTLIVEQDHQGTHHDRPRKDGTLIIYIPHNAKLTYTAIESATGAISCPAVHIDQLHIDLGMGNIMLKGTDVQSVEVYNGMGDVTFDDVTSYETVVSLGMGEVTIDGAFEGDIMVENGMGDIRVTTTKPYKSYNYKLERGVGNIALNGERYSIGQNVDKDYGSDYNMEILTGMGDIKVKTNK